MSGNKWRDETSDWHQNSLISDCIFEYCSTSPQSQPLYYIAAFDSTENGTRSICIPIYVWKGVFFQSHSWYFLYTAFWGITVFSTILSNNSRKLLHNNCCHNKKTLAAYRIGNRIFFAIISPDEYSFVYYIHFICSLFLYKQLLITYQEHGTKLQKKAKNQLTVNHCNNNNNCVSNCLIFVATQQWIMCSFFFFTVKRIG